MNTQELLNKFKHAAENPRELMDSYINKGEKVVLTAPVYTPKEIIHSMGLVPMGAWGGDVALDKAKQYFPAFIISIVQSIVELGMNDVYKGASAIVIPSLTDSLKVLGENWKYAVPSIPFVPMTYPQNRGGEIGANFTKASYERVIKDLEKITDVKFSDDSLADSVAVYNEQNQTMRKLSEILATHPEISAVDRGAIFKSAWFMKPEEHTALVKELIAELGKAESENQNSEGGDNVAANGKIRIITSGLLADNPALLSILDDNDMQIVGDDIAYESRQYLSDAPDTDNALDSLVKKFQNMNNCSVLYDPEKKRVDRIVNMAKDRQASGVIVFLSKFSDAEEFDYPLIKKACTNVGIPVALIEVDRQMTNYAQARTIIETFKDQIGN